MRRSCEAEAFTLHGCTFCYKAVVNQFAEWLSQTPLSLAIQSHEWVIPTLQSIHIVAISVVLGSVFMIDLRILALAGRDQTLVETHARFGPWLSWALLVLLVTGAGMVVGEPARQLLALSFWLKMGLVAAGSLVALIFTRSLRQQGDRWEAARLGQQRVKVLAVVTFLIWVAIVVLGRLIAYDYVWGSWSTQLKG
jgi:hypothetical protein